MKLIPVLALVLSGFLLSGCAIFGVAAVGGAVAEGATADENAEASNGIISEQWRAACEEVGGRVDPKTSDCDGDLIGYLFGSPEPEPRTE